MLKDSSQFNPTAVVKATCIVDRGVHIDVILLKRMRPFLVCSECFNFSKAECMKANGFDYGFTVHNLQSLSTSVQKGFEDTNTPGERGRFG